MKTKVLFQIWIVLIFSVLLTSCDLFQQTTPQAVPTEDQNQLRTEVALTVVARVTYEAALTKAAEPTATAHIISPTIEEFATTTLTPTLPILTYTPTPVTPTATPTETERVIYPTFTPTYYPDRAELVSQSPADGKNISPGLGFDLVFEIKNTGDRTWNTNFYLKYVSGVTGETHAGEAVTLRYLPHSVNPGETVNITIDMIAPLTAGTYSSNWALINDDGTAILSPNFVFFVSG